MISSSHKTTMTFLEHLEELRIRIIKCTCAVMIATCLSLWVSNRIVAWMIKDLPPLVFISPYEVLLVYLKVALFCGIILSLPFFLFQGIRFVISALSPPQKGMLYLTIPGALFCFIIGFLFGYMLLIPLSTRFLLGFATPQIIPMISLNAYISFVGVISIFCGIIFEMPLVTVLLVKLGIVNASALIHYWRQIIVGILVIAALITPTTDIFNQLLLAIPMLLLYGISLVAACLVQPRH